MDFLSVHDFLHILKGIRKVLVRKPLSVKAFPLFAMRKPLGVYRMKIIGTGHLTFIIRDCELEGDNGLA